MDEEQIAWVEMQLELDKGLKYCEPCEKFGWHTFCGSCGMRFDGRQFRWRECSKCHVIVATDYCALCGHLVASEWLKRMERGEIDWRAEGEKAAEVLESVIHRNPQIAEILGRGMDQPPATMAEALMAGLGQR